MNRWYLVLILALGLASLAASADPTYAERLGWPTGARVVIFHCDDAGMSHSSNQGAIQGFERGVLTSVSTMMPCPWVPEWARYLREHPQIDNGLHLTMNSEWTNYRWGPVAGKPAVPSLTDEEGCLWDNANQVIEHAVPDQVETEIRAQIDRAERLGMPITHLDSHMGALFAKQEFFERYLKVGIEKGIPVLMAGGHLTYVAEENPDLMDSLKAMSEKVWAAGLPVIDDVHTSAYDWITFREKRRNLIQVLKTLKPGITEIIVHCTDPTEAFQFITDSGPKRHADLRVMLDRKVKRILQKEGIFLTTWRELKERRDRVGNPK